MKKKIIYIFVLVLLASAFIASSVYAMNQRAVSRERGAQLDAAQQTIARLAALPAVKCVLNINCKNTAVLGKVNAGDFSTIAQQQCEYLRKEMINMKDSIYNYE